MKQIRLVLLTIAMVFLAAALLEAPPASTKPTSPFPHFIDYGQSMAVGATHTYYSKAAHIEGCAIEEGLYGRVANGTAFPEHLVVGCDPPGKGGAMVVDDSHVYYIALVPQLFSSPTLWRRALDGSGESEMLHPTGHVSPLALAMDERNVYFTVVESTTQLFAYNKSSGDITLITGFPPLVAGSGVNRLALDATHIYWTEGDGEKGAVRSVAKEGGSFSTLFESDDVYPWDLERDGDVVFWTDLNGTLNRIYKDGCCHQVIYESPNGAPIRALAVEGNRLYFGSGNESDAAMWRTTLLGAPATLMAFGGQIGRVRDLAYISGYLYWTNGGFYRMDENATSDGVDYVVNRMEVTQAIQDGFNSVPLVTGKPTYVRVYPREASGSADQVVTARLHGFRSNNTPLPGSPLSPLNKVDPDPDGARRADKEETFIFLLPESWVTEQFELQAEINPPDGDQAFETDYENNLYPSVGEPFEAAARVACLVTYPVAAIDANGDQQIFPPPQENLLAALAYALQIGRAETMLPAVVDERPQETILMKTYVDAPWEPFDMTQESERELLFSLLAAIMDNSDPPAGCDDATTLYAGLVSRFAETFDPDANFGFGGQGKPDGRLWTKMFPSSDTPYNDPAGGRWLAHEMGHAVGRPHVGCGGADDPGEYDYDPCQLDNSDDENANWGYDGLSGEVINPLENVDVMAYGGTAWISDFNWRKIYDALAPNGGMAAPRRTAENDILYVRGALNIDGGSFRPFYRFPEAELTTQGRRLVTQSQALQGAATRYAVELRGADDGLLYRQPVETEVHEAAPGEGVFSAAFPYNPDTAEIVLVDQDNDQVVVSRSVSDNAPTTDMVQVNTDGDEMTISWSAGDADGDLLHAIIQYSYGNNRRQAVLVDFPQQQITLSTRGLSGEDGPARIRVYISDGVHTVSTLSARFDLPDRDPHAVITHPQEPTPAGRAVTLRARSFDAEDGRLPPEAGVWRLDGEIVGAGHWVTLPGLEAGEYAVTFEVTDSDGQNNIARATLTVTDMSERLYVPLVRK